MITKYFTKVTVRFNPFSDAAKPVRLFMGRIPSALKSGCTIDYKILTGNEEPLVKVTFKDKQEMEINPKNKRFEDLSSYFDAHSRRLALKDAILE